MGFTVYQMDVKSAFLYGTIDEEVYVIQPPGFHDPEDPAKVYKVEKAMYGLHQAPRAWYGKGRAWKRYRTASRPDIMFAVCACARHQVTPKECHLHAVKRIFRYLKGHPKLGLWYPKASSVDLVAYSDSDYGGASQDRKSTTGGSQFLERRNVVIEIVVLNILSDALPITTIGSDDGVTTSLQLSRNSRPPMLDHQDKYMMKAQGTGSGGSPRCQDTILRDRPTQSRVLALENNKTAQDLEISHLKKRVKRLEEKIKSRTLQLKRRLFKVRIESSAERSSGDQEDASNQGRNDQDEGISFVKGVKI
nr:uncharacterized mitochondrial protein AtMg00810-like [Tanacetum cinerariifolium]